MLNQEPAPSPLNHCAVEGIALARAGAESVLFKIVLSFTGVGKKVGKGNSFGNTTLFLNEFTLCLECSFRIKDRLEMVFSHFLNRKVFHLFGLS